MCAKQRLARYGSFNTVQTSEKIERKVSSEPSSPQGGKQGTGPRSTSGVRELPWKSSLGDTQAFSNDLSRPCRFSQQPTLHLPEVKQLLAAKETLTSQCVSTAPRLKLIQSALINWLAMLGPFDISQKFITWETTFVFLSYLFLMRPEITVNSYGLKIALSETKPEQIWSGLHNPSAWRNCLCCVCLHSTAPAASVNPSRSLAGSAYSLEIGSLAAIYRQKVEDKSQ